MHARFRLLILLFSLLFSTAGWLFTLAAQPLTLAQVLRLIEARSPDNIIAAEILERGIAETVDEKLMETVRRAGAGRASLAALEKIRPRSGLTIRGTPGARITIDGRPVGRLEDSGYLTLKDLTPGQHQLLAELPDYSPLSQSVSLTPNQDAEIEIQLESLFGYLTLTTNAPEATIDVQGVTRFRNEVSKTRLRAGSYLVRVQAPFFQPYAETVEMKSGAAVERHIVLSPDKARLAELLSRAKQSFSQRNYRATIQDMTTYLKASDGGSSTDNTTALTYLTLSQLEVRDYANGLTSARRALAAGAELPLEVVHHHTGMALMKPHAAWLVLSAAAIRYEPNGPCNFRKLSINPSASQVSSVQLSDAPAAVRLSFPKPDKPKDTNTLNFIDDDNRRLAVILNLLRAVSSGSTMP